MITVEEVSFAYGRRRILQDLNLQVVGGELLTIVGPNGAGKSTLLRLLRGRLRPDVGLVHWPQGAAHLVSRAEMARLVAVVPQLATQPFGFSVREVVALGCFARSRQRWGLGVKQKQLVEQVLVLTDVAHLAAQAVDNLSGGELQRVLLARALAQQTPLLFLDEATSQLDLGHKRSIAELLNRLCREQGKTIVQVSHDIDLAAEISDRIIMLDEQGRAVAVGSPEHVLSAESIEKAFNLKVHVDKHPLSGSPRIYPLPIR